MERERVWKWERDLHEVHALLESAHEDARGEVFGQQLPLLLHHLGQTRGGGGVCRKGGEG